ncbi:MAG: RsmF rRNA methyltransferase first C-terminal domain-containing protein [Lachnospiraceae bacterium]|nr:RsmF rRNA methyltransferase first C-terminal domain-containing protein [Lachnospiraceae bacterium]
MNGIITPIDLPEEFKEHMHTLLKDEYDAFIGSYSKERTYGLRLNPLKADIGDPASVLNKMGMGYMADDPVPWCKEGFYYNKDSCPGRSPFHEAGAYYIQEPSAMAVCEALDPHPGELICDLCAAPGGKTTHIAGRMLGRGLLVSNEIIPDRSRILARNVERMGITNCIVTNNPPADLAEAFPGYFDKVCVDAPCSGEGMFRKNPEAIREWSPDSVIQCRNRQLDILDQAAELVREGGMIVYSTCTFEKDENEDVIASFLNMHSEWQSCSTALNRENESDPGNNSNPGCDRLWPHKVKGEGHFVARLIKGSSNYIKIDPRNEVLTGRNDRRSAEQIRFLHTEALPEAGSTIERLISESMIIENKDHFYAVPDHFNADRFKRIHVLRSGLELAEIDHGRYKPAHALAMAMTGDDLKAGCDLTLDEAYSYLRGETINVSDKTDFPLKELNGKWVPVSVNGFSMGWSKLTNGILKNHYPKGLRRDLTRQ